MFIDKRKKQIFRDFVTNIIAVALPIAVLQIFVFPLLAKNIGDQKYGLIVTIVSIMTLFSESFGNVLNNVRLLQEEKYRDVGDFNIILIGGTVFNILIVCIGVYYYKVDSKDFIDVVLGSILILLRAYYIVAFRLKLNYRNIFFNNLILAIGYVVGYIGFIKYNRWIIIYIVANGFSLVHLFITTDLWKEKYKRTFLFNETFRKTIVLYIADVLKTFITYADKLLIYPILGAKAVAYYYAASVMGKMVSMGISPISSVILSYIVKEKNLSKSKMKKILYLVGIFSVLGLLGAYILGRMLLQVLYKDWVDVTIKLLPWTVLAAVLGGVSSVIQPLILRFKNEFYQICINGVHVVVYVVFSLILCKTYGLLGFCIGYCITMVIKLLINLGLLKTVIN